MRTPLAIALMTTLLAAGCVSGADDLTAASTTDSAALAPTTSVEPFAWDGSYTPGVAACPVVTCATLRVAGTDVALAPKGDITALSLTMTWDAASPASEQLRFGITWDEDNYEFVEGASPLVLELDGLNISKDDAPYLWTWPLTPAPQGAVTLLAPQDFHVEGTITEARVAPPADAQAATVLPVSEQGSFGVMAYACAPVTCTGQSLSSSDRVFPQPDAKGTVDVSIVATWAAETPATERLALGVFACPDPCEGDADISAFEFVYGPAPLALEVEGFEVPAGETLYVYMQQGGTSLPGIYALATVPQDFLLEGTLTSASSLRP